MKAIFECYRFIFARPCFEHFNRLLVVLGLKGLGILNYKNARASGELHFLRELLSACNRPVCLDVGANHGDYTKLILKCNREATIHCFEPHPLTFASLSARLATQTGVTLNMVGCGAIPGELTLFDYLESDGSSHASMHRDVIERLHRSRSVGHVVPIITIDEYMTRTAIDRVDLLKIDTEGHELAVLRGAVQSIKEGRLKCIHFEFNEMNAISGSFFRDFFDCLSSYRLYRLLPTSMLEIKEYVPLYCEIFAFQNIVAIHGDNLPRR